MPDEEVKETKLRMLKASEGESKDLRKKRYVMYLKCHHQWKKMKGNQTRFIISNKIIQDPFRSMPLYHLQGLNILQ